MGFAFAAGLELALAVRGRAHFRVPVSGCCLIIGAFSLPTTIRRAGHLRADSPESDLELVAGGGCCLVKLGIVEGLLMTCCCRLDSKTKLEVEGELLMGGGGGGCLGSKLKLERGGEVLILGCCCLCSKTKFEDGEELLIGCCCCKPLIGMGEELVMG